MGGAGTRRPGDFATVSQDPDPGPQAVLTRGQQLHLPISHLPPPLPVSAYSSRPFPSSVTNPIPLPDTHTPATGRPRPDPQTGSRRRVRGRGRRQSPLRAPACPALLCPLSPSPGQGSGHSTCAQRSLRLRGQEAHTRPTPGPGASPGGIDLHPLGTPGGRPVAEALRSSCDRSCSRSSTMGRPALRELTLHPGGGQPERSSPDGNMSLEAPHTRVHGDHA